MSEPPRWLEGIVVLDLTRYLAGPSCTRLLVELGADVIKVEQPPHGDPTRANHPRINRRSGAFIQQNRGKRSVCIDIDTAEGRDLILGLVRHADVVVENFSPGVMASKGLGYADLTAVRPDVIMVSISGFGQTGPLSERPCFELIAQGYAGIMHMTGERDGPPTFVGAGIADTNAGAHAFGAIGHALFHRARTGRGCHLDVAMVDALFHFNEQSVHQPSMDPAYEPVRNGRDYPYLSPAGLFKAPQRWIAILCAEQQMKNLWKALGRPELAQDPRFDTLAHRLEHRAALTELIESWMATFSTDDEVMDALAAARVPHGPVLSPRDALTHPHFVARGTIRTVHDPLAGAVQIPGFPWRASDPLPPDDHVAAALGEHNAIVLGGMLGLSDDQLSDLAARGVIASKDR
jgi:CoA:oxalate CoA-transferase